MSFFEVNPRAWENAEYVLKTLGRVKAGECVAIVTDDPLRDYARLLLDAARRLGASGLLLDIGAYADARGFLPVPVMEPLSRAILSADAAFLVADQKHTNFGRLLGNRDKTDQFLLKHSRRYTLEARGMDAWHIDAARIDRDRARAERLCERFQKGRELHVTTARGTDFTCQVGGAPDGMYPVLGILPFYSEVAVVPSLGSVTGVVVADGASEIADHHRGYPIRSNMPGACELYMEPMRLTFEGSVLVDYKGASVQEARLRSLLARIDPRPDLCDEVAVVTCTSPENDLYGWRVDGSHQTRCVHVALGNNRRRGEIIHSTEHVDFDVHAPTVTLDGETIMRDGVFPDEE